jgi:hypothetical protein
VIPIPTPIESPVERDDECVLEAEALWEEDMLLVNEGVDEGVDESVDEGVNEGVDEGVGEGVTLEAELELEPPCGLRTPPCNFPADDEDDVPAAADWYEARVLPEAGGLITPTIPLWQ